MHVEIHHRHPFQAVSSAGVGCANRRIIKYAETHRLIGLGVVTGRTDCAKSIVGLLRDQGVNRRADRARRP